MKKKIFYILGLPNAGKSSLIMEIFNFFNRLSNKPIVHVSEHTTRDCASYILSETYTLVDTPGIEEENIERILSLIGKHGEDEARCFIYLSSLERGVSLMEKRFVKRIFRELKSKPEEFIHLINKGDLTKDRVEPYEYLRLGLGDTEVISTKKSSDIKHIVETLDLKVDWHSREETTKGKDRIVILGRPNTGKSTLFNMIFQRDYSLVSSEPHTTRDVIRLEKDQRLFSDTAGVTKRQRQSDTIRYISYRLTNREFKEASAVIVIVDISDLNFLYVDRELIGRAIELQIPTLIIFNKIDLVDDEMLQQYKLAVKKRHLIPRYLPVFYLSLKEDNSKTILSTLDLLLEQGRSRYSVKYLNDTIRTRINARLLGNKMRFIKQTANKTPSFLIFMARLLDANRFKFVENALREELKLNIPIAVRQVRSR